MANLAVVFDLIARDRASSELRRVGSAADEAGGKTEKFAGIAKAGLLAVAGGAAAFGAASIKAGGDFDKTMRQIAAVTGEPKSGLEDLSKLALKLGADTAFSAGEAGDAMLELAKGGLTTAQIKAGALDQTLTLAAAGGLALGKAATFVTSGLNTFGLKAKDAGQVAAALAGGANASSASVESLGEALSQVGPGAVNAGLSIQETTAALSAFANAGIQGSDAGTSLKTFLTRLVPSTKEAKRAFEDLGLSSFDSAKALRFLNEHGVQPLQTDSASLQEHIYNLLADLNDVPNGSAAANRAFSDLIDSGQLTSNALVDVNGNFKSLADISGILQDKLGGLTQEQQTQALTTLFGADATRAASVLIKEGAEGIERYTKATSDQASAQRIAKSAMEGQAGAIEQFKGSVETLLTTVGRELAPVVTKIALLGTTVVNGVVPAFKAITSTVPTPVLKALGVVVGTVTAAIVIQTAATLAARTATGLWTITTGLFTTVKTAEGVVLSRGTVVLLAHNVAMIASRTATIAATIASTAMTVGLGILAAATSLATLRAFAATAATAAWTAAQTALNFALRANPIGIVITVIAALAAGIVVAYKQSDTFRGIVDRLWASIRTATSRLGDFLQELRGFKIPAWVKELGGLFGGIGSGIKNATGRIGGLFGSGDGVGIGGEGGQPRGVSAMMSAVRSAFPGTQLISGVRPGAKTPFGNESYHAKGRAVDLPPSMAIFNWIRANFGKNSKELFFSPADAAGLNILNGKSGYRLKPVTKRDHYDHVHWALHQGGRVGAGIPRSYGDTSTERTIRAQVGEVVTTQADMGDVLAELRGVRAALERLPKQYQLAARTA